MPMTYKYLLLLKVCLSTADPSFPALCYVMCTAPDIEGLEWASRVSTFSVWMEELQVLA
jgi:hypothetical protein